ncbi:ATP-binding cassette domain-containing protein [Malacoplasma muris]|uniref:ATP-binding cassette domain-containing protein n=1 Tax=Malacoplasma muris TaxID=2119 RepID=UPI00398F389A
MIVLKDISVKNIGQKENILTNINLNFYPNQFVAIIGKSGVGKTTLLNTLCLNVVITHGCIEYKTFLFDKNTRKKLKNYRKKIGIISQNSTLINEISVFDNLKIYLSNENNLFYKLFNIITKEQKSKIFNVLEQLNILDKVFYKPLDLSGGESQRVEIAKILLKKPEIILADEPTSNLDINNSLLTIKLLKEVATKENSIVLINLHDTKLLNDNFDRVIGIKNRSIMLNKEPKKITKKDLRDLYE